MEAIEYYEDRELDKRLITNLATCAYIRDNHHVVLKGTTGAGKSYIANALGVAACRHLYKVRYVRMPNLLNEYAVAKSLNTQNKIKKAYSRFDLLIIDEWLLRPLPESEAYNLLELIDACSRKEALILCTQYDVVNWYYRIDCDQAEDEGSAVAKGILNRIINNKYNIEIKGRISMRKRHHFQMKKAGRMTMADNTIYDLLDEVNCADSCETVTALCELLDELLKDIHHLDLKCMSIPWLQSHSIRYREPSIPNDRAT